MEEAIEATIQRMQSTAFVWGSNDCDTIVADYVRKLTGRDPMAKWRGQYHDEAGARAFIESANGNGSLIEEGLASIGIHPRLIGEPSRGDVALLDIRGDQICGLYLGYGFTIAKGLGVNAIQTKIKPVKAWKCV